MKKLALLAALTGIISGAAMAQNTSSSATVTLTVQSYMNVQFGGNFNMTTEYDAGSNSFVGYAGAPYAANSNVNFTLSGVFVPNTTNPAGTTWYQRVADDAPWADALTAQTINRAKGAAPSNAYLNAWVPLSGGTVAGQVGTYTITISAQ
jgi:hypothetical protein